MYSLFCFSAPDVFRLTEEEQKAREEALRDHAQFEIEDEIGNDAETANSAELGVAVSSDDEANAKIDKMQQQNNASESSAGSAASNSDDESSGEGLRSRFCLHPEFSRSQLFYYPQIVCR